MPCPRSTISCERRMTRSVGMFACKRWSLMLTPSARCPEHWQSQWHPRFNVCHDHAAIKTLPGLRLGLLLNAPVAELVRVQCAPSELLRVQLHQKCYAARRIEMPRCCWLSRANVSAAICTRMPWACDDATAWTKRSQFASAVLPNSCCE